MINKVLRLSRNILVGFFLVVFIMGFFSKSIINLFLPKVHTASAVEAPVERTLVLEGTVEPGNIIKICYGGEVVVDEFLVKQGDVMDTGDPLFSVNPEYIGFDGSSFEALKLELEGELLKMESYKNKVFTEDEADIKVLQRKLDASNAKLLKNEELYRAGAIAEAELEAMKEDIFEQEANLEKNKLLLDSKKVENTVSVKEAEARVKKLQSELSEMKRQQQLYTRPDKEGICYSKVKGIVLSINTAGMALPKEAVLAEIAETGNGKPLLYAAEADSTEYDFIKNMGRIEIGPTGSSAACKVRVTNLSRVVEAGKIAVKGEFIEGDTGGYVIGQELKGTITRKYEHAGFLTVPKASLIAFDGFYEGKSGTVYLLEEKEGVLGKEYAAKQVEVRILAVGDKDVIVSGLEGYESPKVISDPSYKISDGTKVFLWK